MHGCQTLYANRTFNSLQFAGFLNEWLIFYVFFAQLKRSGRIYTLMAVSGLIKNSSLTFSVYSYI